MPAPDAHSAMASLARRDPAHRVRFPLRLADGTPAIVCELSAGGMYLETRTPLAPGQLLEFELHPPGSHFAFTAKGIVVEVNPRLRPPGVRVRFTDLRMRARHRPD